MKRISRFLIAAALASLARLAGRIALDEVLPRFPQGWRVDYANAVQARTSTARGWERLPVFTD